MPFELLSYTSGDSAPPPSLAAQLWQVWGLIYPPATMALVMVGLCLFGMLVLK